MVFALPPTNGRIVAVLGGGVLGRRVACAWAASGFEVVIRDPSPEQRTAAVHYCEVSMKQYSDSKTPASVSATSDLAASVKNAWLVIEVVPEKLSLKISTFADLEKLAPADALLCSNSSSYKSREMVGDLQESTKQRVSNMHYYMPPDNRIVELMTSGSTNESVFPFLVEKLRSIGMHPFVAQKESTGLIFNRLWAAVKREVLNILAEDVSTPEEIDAIWSEAMGSKGYGPVAMMDHVGLDTVAFIEQHYITERGLPSQPVDFLKRYIDKGRIGIKSGQGGLLPAEFYAKVHTKPEEHTPLLYFLDVGLAVENPLDVFHAGRILVGSADGRPLKELVVDQLTPDGIGISLKFGKVFWTSMGIPSRNDGALYSCNLDGSHITAIVPKGTVHTPKQLTLDHLNEKIYFSDREGLRVFRCNYDGSELENLVKTGDWQNDEHAADQTRWCVGIAVSPATGKFYWTQKGPSKGNKGRIFRANMAFPAGENVKTRSDVDTIFQNLPEPIDLELDHQAGTLYWTDRGELPLGNSINRVSVADIKPVTDTTFTSWPGRDYSIIMRNLHEAIGIKLDTKNRHIYATDLGGVVYQTDMDGGNRKKLYENSGAFAGITLAHF
ncbi:3-hydroxybutyryl-CoA dehydrogenase [Beauveria bassiana]|nr:3-hydroxybutyryl-CoA dehydrogenase [Beauveria bassiana]KAH8716560.1 3-hydroxyacyl-CoA dehydrogenase-like protein LAM1 [Beauveria bassiana]